MRLMLGTPGQPSLLVNIEQERSVDDFDFWVVNGAWPGVFYNGHVTVLHPDNPWSDLDKTVILTDNQDRLRGDYNDVFNNFHNPDYMAPEHKKAVWPTSWDDDIPF